MDPKTVKEKISEDVIVLDANGKFPKKIRFVDCGKTFQYRIVKTRAKKFQLSK